MCRVKTSFWNPVSFANLCQKLLKITSQIAAYAQMVVVPLSAAASYSPESVRYIRNINSNVVSQEFKLLNHIRSTNVLCSLDQFVDISQQCLFIQFANITLISYCSKNPTSSIYIIRLYLFNNMAVSIVNHHP